MSRLAGKADGAKLATVRCFAAIWPAPEVVSALRDLPRPDIPGLGWTGAAQWHVTLRFFGELSSEEMGMAVNAIQGGVVGAACGLAPVQAEGGPSTRLLGPGLVIWPVTGLEEVAAVVRSATSPIGRPPEDRPFLGHITLGRAKRGTDLRRRRRELLLPLRADWPVSAIDLVQSQLHPQGARYTVLAQVPLR